MRGFWLDIVSEVTCSGLVMFSSSVSSSVLGISHPTGDSGSIGVSGFLKSEDAHM